MAIWFFIAAILHFYFAYHLILVDHKRFNFAIWSSIFQMIVYMCFCVYHLTEG